MLVRTPKVNHGIGSCHAQFLDCGHPEIVHMNEKSPTVPCAEGLQGDPVKGVKWSDGSS
jgi:hypothetical protein